MGAFCSYCLRNLYLTQNIDNHIYIFEKMICLSENLSGLSVGQVLIDLYVLS